MLKTIRKMLALVTPYRGQYLAGQTAMLVVTAAGLAFPWAVRSIFDQLFEGGEMRPLLLAIAGLAVVLVVKEVANLVKNNALGYIGQKMIRDLRAQLYEKLLRLSLDYYAHRSSGEIASRMSNDMNLLQQGISSGLAFIIQQVISLIVVVILLVRIDPILTLSVLGTIPLIIFVSQKTGERAKAISQSVQERLGNLMSIMNESISGIDVIKAFVLEHYALGLFGDQNERILSKSVKGIRVSSLAGLIIGLLNGLFLLVVIGLGGYRVSRGFLSAPDLIAFILYSEMVAGPISVLAGLYVEVNKAVAAYRRIESILTTRNDIVSIPHPVRPEHIEGRIEFDHVSFGYNSQQLVLRDITCTIEQGETVAIVGPSGVGKSTLVKLIPRFYNPTSGSLRVDGIEAGDYNLEYLRSQIAIVPQETHLFGFSIGENIACGQPEASKEQIIAAARMANAHEFISEMERGYDAEIGESGVRLSGGQRQRIAIARAFMQDPRILILDEATSALDTHAERKVQDALDKLMTGRTTLIIAHRLSTIERADKIVVLRDGQVLAIGTHEHLLQTCPFYRDLYQKQFSPTATPKLPRAA